MKSSINSCIWVDESTQSIRTWWKIWRFVLLSTVQSTTITCNKKTHSLGDSRRRYSENFRFQSSIFRLSKIFPSIDRRRLWSGKCRWSSAWCGQFYLYVFSFLRTRMIWLNIEFSCCSRSWWSGSRLFGSWRQSFSSGCRCFSFSSSTNE